MDTTRKHHCQPLTALTIVTAIFLGFANESLFAQLLQTSEWKQDEIGYSYREVFRDGRWQREYHQPTRQAVAWEVGRHLPQAGLPAPADFRRSSGVDAFGRHWTRDELGFAFYETGGPGCLYREYYQPSRRATAAYVHGQLACADFEAAVRAGAANATVRGLNAAGQSAAGLDTEVRSAVEDLIVDALNRAGNNRSPQGMQQFQRLLAEGVEDAIVRAFNQLDVVPSVGDNLPFMDSLGMAPRPPGPRDSLPNSGSTGSPTPPDPQGSSVLLPASGQRPGTESSNGQECPLDARHPHFATHYAGALRGTALSDRYSAARLVSTGWVVGDHGVRPLRENAYLLLGQKQPAGLVDVWNNGVLLYEDCRYAEFFEDTQALTDPPSIWP